MFSCILFQTYFCLPAYKHISILRNSASDNIPWNFASMEIHPLMHLALNTKHQSCFRDKVRHMSSLRKCIKVVTVPPEPFCHTTDTNQIHCKTRRRNLSVTRGFILKVTTSCCNSNLVDSMIVVWIRCMTTIVVFIRLQP